MTVPIAPETLAKFRELAHKSLPETARMLFRAGRDTAEIAAILGYPESSIYSALHRAAA